MSVPCALACLASSLRMSWKLAVVAVVIAGFIVTAFLSEYCA